MTDYARFARFYDRIMGDRDEEIARIQGYLARHQPGATTLLELGCGTGALLAGLAPQLRVTGIDRSPEMLAIAAGKVPEAHLVRGDMTAFELPGRFDVVICMFDTLNHVPDFGRWLTLFSCVHEHLADGGLFVFDVNTVGRLAGLDGAPPYLDEFDGNVVVMTVRSAGGWLSEWRTRIFERLDGDLYRLHDEPIHELGVPLAPLRAALAGRFELLEEESLDGSPVSDESDRVFFAYRHASPPPTAASQIADSGQLSSPAGDRPSPA
jgi:SAM-dependent methyltransferase